MAYQLFKDPWFEGRMSDEMSRMDDATPDAQAVARAIMVAAAFISQAIESSIGPDVNNRPPGGLAEQVAALTDAVEQSTEEVKYLAAAIRDSSEQ